MMLQGKNIVVTGTKRGIGKAIVCKLASEGANVWACARKKDDGFEEKLNEIALKNGVVIEPVYFDLTDEGQIKEAVKNIVKSKRPIDGLVNNAGIAAYNKLQMMKIDEIKNIFSTNYFSALYLTQLLMRRITRNTGSIVFVSSVSGFIPEIGNIAYGGSKAAVSHAVKILAKELSSEGIRVNAVAPGLVNTDMKNLASEEVWEELKHRIMIGRVAEPNEIANVISFLLSDQSSYMTAQTVHVDGGMF
ncbi:MAG: SDR family oxidoreductase [Lachnospiraceae bacterium]|nr:SDR family oxidoreductase [Lachnospiraceae bacterium]